MEAKRVTLTQKKKNLKLLSTRNSTSKLVTSQFGIKISTKISTINNNSEKTL